MNSILGALFKQSQAEELGKKIIQTLGFDSTVSIKWEAEDVNALSPLSCSWWVPLTVCKWLCSYSSSFSVWHSLSVKANHFPWGPARVMMFSSKELLVLDLERWHGARDFGHFCFHLMLEPKTTLNCHCTSEVLQDRLVLAWGGLPPPAVFNDFFQEWCLVVLKTVVSAYQTNQRQNEPSPLPILVWFSWNFAHCRVSVLKIKLFLLKYR